MIRYLVTDEVHIYTYNLETMFNDNNKRLITPSTEFIFDAGVEFTAKELLWGSNSIHEITIQNGKRIGEIMYTNLRFSFYEDKLVDLDKRVRTINDII